jgi:hypothetical protein
MNLKALMLTAAVLAIPSMANARPQLHTASIGWINPGSVACEANTDHICTVKSQSNTFTSQQSGQTKYQVSAGTELVVVNWGRGNDHVTIDAENTYVFFKRVEVAIVIPADWGEDGNLHPTDPCHLSFKNKAVSLMCDGKGSASYTMLGDWCTDLDLSKNGHHAYYRPWRRACEDVGPTIRPDGYSDKWNECKFKKITQTATGWLATTHCEAMSEGNPAHKIGISWDNQELYTRIQAASA